MNGGERSTVDVVVVGSGASAVNAAWPLVNAGLRVVMLDVGAEDHHYAALIPEQPFAEIRRTDPQQHRFFLGDRFEGVPFGSVRVGAQLTPPRAFINRNVEELTPVDSSSFMGMESLAVGGLAAGWGAGVCRFNARDLAETPISPGELEPHYAAVEQRIGVCGKDDDLTPHLGLLAGMMPPLLIDTGSCLLFDRYRRRAAQFQERGLAMGITRLAACSQRFRGRGPHPYDDLDFWADKARAVYRPRWTIEELSLSENFTFVRDRLVTRFRETATGVQVWCRRLLDAGQGKHCGAEETYEARGALLAAGVFGTARIVLRSFDLYDRPVPFVCNPYTYAPCLNLNMLGREAADARHSLSQLTATFEPPDFGEDVAEPLHVSVYSYRSLLTFKLMKEAAIGCRSALRLMRSLTPFFTILGVHHADRPSPAKTLTLRRGAASGPDRLQVTYGLSPAEDERIECSERALLRIMRGLGCFCLKRVRPGHGSSLHYAGTLPMREEPGDLQTNRVGLLAGTRTVYVADGSLLPHLPAKGLTLTLMANADRIGTYLAKGLS